MFTAPSMKDSYLKLMITFILEATLLKPAKSLVNQETREGHTPHTFILRLGTKLPKNLLIPYILD
jgi:hypothetical protein